MMRIIKLFVAHSISRQCVIISRYVNFISDDMNEFFSTLLILTDWLTFWVNAAWSLSLVYIDQSCSYMRRIDNWHTKPIFILLSAVYSFMSLRVYVCMYSVFMSANISICRIFFSSFDFGVPIPFYYCFYSFQPHASCIILHRVLQADYPWKGKGKARKMLFCLSSISPISLSLSLNSSLSLSSSLCCSHSLRETSHIGCIVAFRDVILC